MFGSCLLGGSLDMLGCIVCLRSCFCYIVSRTSPILSPLPCLNNIDMIMYVILFVFYVTICKQVFVCLLAIRIRVVVSVGLVIACMVSCDC